MFCVFACLVNDLVEMGDGMVYGWENAFCEVLVFGFCVILMLASQLSCNLYISL